MAETNWLINRAGVPPSSSFVSAFAGCQKKIESPAEKHLFSQHFLMPVPSLSGQIGRYV